MGDLLNTMGSAVVGMGMGMYNDARQKQTNDMNQKRQMEGMKEMSNFQYGQEMRKWQDTGYGAQKDQLKEAGLNPALMYGMGGGGGQSSNVGSGGSVQGGAATNVNAGSEMQNGMQLMLMRAQKENIEADTVNKKSQVPVNEAKVPNIEANTGETLANTTNIEAKTAIANIQKRTEEARAKVAEGTVAEAIGEITYQMRKTDEEVTNLVRQNHINAAVKDEVIRSFKLANTETLANIALKEVQKDNTVQMTAESKAKVLQWIKENVMRQTEIGIKGRAVDIEGLEQGVDQTFKEAMIRNGQWQNFLNGMGQIIRMGK